MYESGHYVEIISTEVNIHRIPGLVGCVGVIKSAPTHPRTWYEVEINGKIHKLQPTCFQPFNGDHESAMLANANALSSNSPLSSGYSSTESLVQADGNTEETLCKQPISATSSFDSLLSTSEMLSKQPGQQRLHRERRPPSAYEPTLPSHCQPSSFSQSSNGFSKGSKVVILGTGQVMQKSPHFVGRVGTVKEVPVHPTTWYKIEFDDGIVSTFRPSALSSYGESAATNYYSSSNARSSLSDSDLTRLGEKSSSASRGLRAVQSNPVLSGMSNHSDEAPNGSNGSGGRVIAGTSAVASSSNNRYVGFLLSSIDPDLWVGLKVRIKAGRFNGEIACVHRSGNGWLQLQLLERCDEVAKRASDLEVVDENTAGADAPEDDVARRVQRDREKAKTIPARHPVTPHSSAVGGRRRDRAYSDDMSHDLDRARSQGAFKASVSWNDFQSMPTRVRPPIVSSHVREQRRSYVQKYVDRQADRLKNRPNLTYWKHCVVGSLIDPVVEAKTATMFIDSICSSCRSEMWPGAKFCWNQECFSSPIYWQLPGARGTPFPAPVATDPHRSVSPIPPSLSATPTLTQSSLRIFEDIPPNAVTTYLLNAPARVLSVNPGNDEDCRIVGLHTVGEACDTSAENGTPGENGEHIHQSAERFEQFQSRRSPCATSAVSVCESSLRPSDISQPTQKRAKRTKA